MGKLTNYSDYFDEHLLQCTSFFFTLQSVDVSPFVDIYVDVLPQDSGVLLRQTRLIASSATLHQQVMAE
jgi:hypothetical protein